MSMLRPNGEDPATALARTLSRRRFLDRGLRGITAGAIGVFTGRGLLSGVARAGGEECLCNSPRGVVCTDCPKGRKRKKCPDGHRRCRTVDGVQQCSGCIYDTGYWVSCTGLGEGFGYRLCVDCWVPGDCDTTCGCRSAVICGKCTSTADVRAEMAIAMSSDE